MRRSLAVAVVVAITLLAAATPSFSAPTNATTPPSFALWTAQWASRSSKAMDNPIAQCAKLLGGQTSTKSGACAMRVLQIAYKTLIPQWEQAVAEIARGQTRPCRVAIHSYWLASRKGQAANLIYLRSSHPSITIVQILSDLSDEPYSTLKSLTDEAKSHAIRVCG
jgi:hypothetical protein